MASSNKSISGIVIQIALALYFFVTGLCLLGVGGSTSSNEIIDALSFLHLNTQLMRIILGVVVLLSGILLVIRFFTSLKTLDTIFLMITLILWIVVTVLMTLFYISKGYSLMFILMDIAKNCLVIGALLSLSL